MSDEALVWLYEYSISISWTIYANTAAINFTGPVAFGEMLQCSRMQFLDGLRYVDNPVLQFLSAVV